MKIKKVLIFVLTIFIFCSPVAFLAGAEWEEYVDYTMFSGDIYEEDFSSDYGRHVGLMFVFTNITDNRRIKGIELKARFYDHFGDLVYETEPIKSNVNLSPGEDNLIDSFGGEHIFEADSDKETPYDILTPLLRDSLPDNEVAVTRIAFANYDPVKFKELEWVGDSLREQETEWTSPIHKYEELQGDFSIENIKITTEKWRIGFLSFDEATGATLKINIYYEDNNLFTSEEFEFGIEYEHTNFGDIILDESGSFSAEIVTEGDFEYEIYINEQKN